MKNLSSIGTLLVVCALSAFVSACSSGSSNGPDALTSTNTVPAGTESAAPDNDESANNGPSDTTSIDNSPSEDDPTSTETETQSDSSEQATNTGSESGENGAVEGATTEPDGGDTSTDNNGSAEQNVDVDVDGDADGDEVDASTEVPDSVSTIDPLSVFGEFQSRIKTLAGRTLIALNQSLNQGELLTPQQEQCVGSFDPAVGEPLLAVDCEQALATGSVPIYMSAASFDDTEQCRASLFNANANDCVVDVAALTVNTLWVIPEVAPGQPERPIPNSGAQINYNVTPNRVSIENLEQNLSGRFYCEFDLTTGEPQSSGQIGDCDSELKRITNLIDQHLSNQLP